VEELFNIFAYAYHGILLNIKGKSIDAHNNLYDYLNNSTERNYPIPEGIV
jgi:hypothetical protein